VRACVCEVWRSGRTTRLLLLDRDATTRESADGWRQLNTLAHYHVPNDARLLLVSRSFAAESPGGDSPITRTVNGNNTVGARNTPQPRSATFLNAVRALLADILAVFFLRAFACKTRRRQMRFSSSKYTKTAGAILNESCVGRLQRSPIPPSWFSGDRFAAGKWREGNERKGEGMGAFSHFICYNLTAEHNNRESVYRQANTTFTSITFIMLPPRGH